MCSVFYAVGGIYTLARKSVPVFRIRLLRTAGFAGVAAAILAKWVFRPWALHSGFSLLRCADWLPGFFILTGTVFLILSWYPKKPAVVIAGCLLFNTADEMVQLVTPAVFDSADLVASLCAALLCFLVLPLFQVREKVNTSAAADSD